MSSVQHLREFISERLAAAAQEIFSEFEKTIEEELEVQRRLLDINWRRRNLTAERQQQQVDEQEEMDCCLDLQEAEPPQIKDRPVELWTRQKDKSLLLKRFSGGFVCRSGLSEDNTVQFQDKMADQQEPAQISFHTPELPQQHVDEEEVVMDQQLWKQEDNFSLDQEEPGESHIKQKRVVFWTWQEDGCLLKKDPGGGFVFRSRCEETSGLSEDNSVQVQDQMAGPISKEDKVLDNKIKEDHVEPEPPQIRGDQEEPEPPQIRGDQEEPEPLQIRGDQTEPETPQIRGDQQEPETPQTRGDQQEPEPPHIRGNQEEPEPPQIKGEPVDPEPPQIKEEPVELSSSPDEEQLVLKEETDVFMVTVNYEASDQSGPEPTSTQLFSHSLNFPPLKGEPSLDPGGIKPYSCKTCGKRFSDFSVMNFHQQTHRDEKPYSCETCLKSFGRRDSMLRHMITHTGERPYSCQICGDKFGLNSHLLRHMRTHTGEKPFSCQICLKSFSQSNSLTDHMRIHTGEKPYCCSLCGKCYVQRGALTIHMRTHTGEKPYSCSMCGKRFSQNSRVKDHERTHTGERPYSCSLCGKCFIQSCHLKTHIRNVHM